MVIKIGPSVEVGYSQSFAPKAVSQREIPAEIEQLEAELRLKRKSESDAERKYRDLIRPSIHAFTQTGTQDDLFRLRYAESSTPREDFEYDVPNCEAAIANLELIQQAELEEAAAKEALEANQSSVSADELARAIPTASEGASLAGASSAETMAVVAGISDQFNTPQTSADRTKALAMKISLDRGMGGDNPRESLQGKGLVDGVRSLMAMTDGQRRDILGTDAESNTAYELIARKIDQIEKDQAVIQGEIAMAGTDQSAIARKRSIAMADPKLSAQRQVAMSENQLEIVREARRARGEGALQAETNNVLSIAEIRGDSQEAIATSELLGSAVSLVAPESLQGAAPVVMQGSLGFSSGLETARSVSRFSNPITAGLSVFEMANSLRGAARGAAATTSTVDYGAQQAASLAAIAAAIAKQNELVAEQNALLAETADNTAPRRAASPDYDAVLNQSMAEQDNRE